MAVGKRKARGHTKRAGGNKDAHELRLRRFIEAYIANGGNATSAAIQAGAPAKSAHVTGCRLLTEAKESGLLEQRQQQVLKRLEVRTETMLRKLVAIAESDLTQFLDAKGRILPPSEWPAEARGAVQAWKKGKFGYEIKLHDAKGAVEVAMRHLGLFKDDNKQKADALAELLKAIGENGDGFAPGSAAK